MAHLLDQKVTLLDKVIAPHRQKPLGPEQPIYIVVVSAFGTSGKAPRLVAKTTLRELADEYSVSRFGPHECGLTVPLVLVTTEYTGGAESVYGTPQVMTLWQYQTRYGEVPTEVVTE